MQTLVKNQGETQNHKCKNISESNGYLLLQISQKR